MPLNIDPQLIDELVKRKIAEDEFNKQPASSSAAPGATSLNPTIAALAGAGLDAATTAAFLHNSSAKEDNALFAKGGAPVAVGGAVATGLLNLLLHRLLPEKMKPVADQLGAYQLGVAASNLSGLRDSAFDNVTDALTRAGKQNIPGVNDRPDIDKRLPARRRIY